MRHKLLATLAMIASSQILSAGQVPIAVTGFGNDLVLNTTPAGVTDWSGGSSSFAFYSPAYATNNGPAPYPGLPSSFTSAFSGVTFNLADFAGNNSIDNSGTFTLVNPTQFSSLQFLVNSIGQNGATFTATLNFVGGGTDTLTSSTLLDWTAGFNAASGPVGLYNLGSSSYLTALPVYLHEADFTLSNADQSQVLNSITLSTTSGSADYFAVSGNVSATPEPSAFTLAALGAGLLISSARRMRKK